MPSSVSMVTGMLKAKVEEKLDKGEETVEDMKKRVEDLTQRIKKKLEGK